jgi:hypothetical protein
MASTETRIALAGLIPSSPIQTGDALPSLTGVTHHRQPAQLKNFDDLPVALDAESRYPRRAAQRGSFKNNVHSVWPTSLRTRL